MANYYDMNRSASIKTRESKNNKLRTETRNREDGFSAAVTTDKRTNSTELFIDFDGGNIEGGETFRLDGRKARTLFRLLSRHYGFTGKSFNPIVVDVGV